MKQESVFGAGKNFNTPYNILVVDDDGQILELVSRILSSVGYSTVIRKNGMEALHEFRLNPTDLVISDFDMGFMNGVELATHIKSLSPFTPVVLMTGCNVEDIREKITGSEIDFILPKPFTPDELKELVEAFQISRCREHAGSG